LSGFPVRCPRDSGTCIPPLCLRPGLSQENVGAYYEKNKGKNKRTLKKEQKGKRARP